MDTVERCPTCGAIKCPSCHAPLKEGITVCPYCGVEFRISPDGSTFTKVERLVCPHCGAKISRSDPFCPSCHRKAWQYCPNLDCSEKFDLEV
ncbi:MAG: zinc-ribbon domain-containing protein, partial [bacterium]